MYHNKLSKTALRVRFDWCWNWEFTAFSFEICRPSFHFLLTLCNPHIFQLLLPGTSEKPTYTSIQAVKMGAGATLFYYLILFNPTLFVSYSGILVIKNYQLFGNYLFTVVNNFWYSHRRKKIKVVLQSVFNSKIHQLKIMGNIWKYHCSFICYCMIGNPVVWTHKGLAIFTAPGCLSQTC